MPVSVGLSLFRRAPACQSHWAIFPHLPHPPARSTGSASHGHGNNSQGAPCATDAAIPKEMRADGRAVSQHGVDKVGVHTVLVESHMVLSGGQGRAEQLQGEDVVGACGISASQHSSAALHTLSPGRTEQGALFCCPIVTLLFCCAPLIAIFSPLRCLTCVKATSPYSSHVPERRGGRSF